MISFKNGKQAVLFYVAARGWGYADTGPDLSRIHDDEGHHLRYDSNLLPGPPKWCEIADALMDLEMIFKKTLTMLETRCILNWGRDESDNIDIDPRPEGLARKPLHELSDRGRAMLILSIIVKLEAGLQKYGYMKKRKGRMYRTKDIASLAAVA